MKQLTIRDIMDFGDKLINEGMTEADVKDLPIYIGDDDELNGIHTAWFCQVVRNTEEDEYIRNMIEEDKGNIQIDDSKLCILIS